MLTGLLRRIWMELLTSSDDNQDNVDFTNCAVDIECDSECIDSSDSEHGESGGGTYGSDYKDEMDIPIMAPLKEEKEMTPFVGFLQSCNGGSKNERES